MSWEARSLILICYSVNSTQTGLCRFKDYAWVFLDRAAEAKVWCSPAKPTGMMDGSVRVYSCGGWCLITPKADKVSDRAARHHSLGRWNNERLTHTVVLMYLPKGTVFMQLAVETDVLDCINLGV